jgi:metallophosphoesterase superfamily enzyme
VKHPLAAVPEHPLADGVVALAHGFAYLPASRVLICADAHFGYEDVMGGGSSLPLWSTVELAATIALAAQRVAAREIVFLGDAIHGARMSAGAVRVVVEAFDSLRALAAVTFIAGNHEGRTRGAAILGATVEACERDGWLLLHGDKPGPLGTRAIIGHLHPSIQLGGGTTSPAFLAAERLVVVPALTPYSSGLDVLGDACIEALAPWNVTRRDLEVVGVTSERVYPFGTLSRLRGALRAPQTARAARPFKRRRLRPDRPPV